MNRPIIITAGDLTLHAELNNSPTADQLWDALPFEGPASVWGDEIYFEVPFEAEQAQDAREQVEVGELGFWPLGRAFCIFYGPTPVSRDERPRAYSPVNVVGRVLDDATALRGTKSGALVSVIRGVVA